MLTAYVLLNFLLKVRWSVNPFRENMFSKRYQPNCSNITFAGHSFLSNGREFFIIKMLLKRKELLYMLQDYYRKEILSYWMKWNKRILYQQDSWAKQFTRDSKIPSEKKNNLTSNMLDTIFKKWIICKTTMDENAKFLFDFYIGVHLKNLGIFFCHRYIKV